MNVYSEDLRMKIVEALGRGMGKSEAARTFSVSLSSVKRYARKVARSRPRNGPAQPKLDERSRKLLEADLKEHPFLTLQERCEYLRAVASVEISRSSVCRAIKRMNSTRKKGEIGCRTRRVLESCLESDGRRSTRSETANLRR